MTRFAVTRFDNVKDALGRIVRPGLGVMVASIAASVGCDPTASPVIARVEVLSADSIDSVGSIADAVKALQDTAGDASDDASGDAAVQPLSDDVASDGDRSAPGGTMQVAIRGRVGAGDQPAFEPDKAAFLVSEIIDDPNAGDGHDASTCPFCKRRLEKSPRAYVVMVDDAGQPIADRADRLLGLSRDEIVQVRGVGSFDPAINTLTIRARVIHRE